MHTISTPTTPFYSVIPGGVHPGTVVEINGNTGHHHHGKKFEINLVHGAHESWHHAHGHHVGLKIKVNARKGKIYFTKVDLN